MSISCCFMSSLVMLHVQCATSILNLFRNQHKINSLSRHPSLYVMNIAKESKEREIPGGLRVCVFALLTHIDCSSVLFVFRNDGNITSIDGGPHSFSLLGDLLLLKRFRFTRGVTEMRGNQYITASFDLR